MKGIIKFVRWLQQPFIVILFLGLVASYLMTVFQDPKTNTLPVTNIGFLMLLGLANVCFSWARAIESENQVKISCINTAAEKAISASVYFLIGSLIKYIFISKMIFGNFFSHTVIIYIGSTIWSVGFTWAAFLTLKVLGTIITLTFKHTPIFESFTLGFNLGVRHAKKKFEKDFE